MTHLIPNIMLSLRYKACETIISSWISNESIAIKVPTRTLCIDLWVNSRESEPGLELRARKIMVWLYNLQNFQVRESNWIFCTTEEMNFCNIRLHYIWLMTDNWLFTLNLQSCHYPAGLYTGSVWSTVIARGSTSVVVLLAPAILCHKELASKSP